MIVQTSTSMPRRGSAFAHAFNAATGVAARASSQIVTVVVTLYAARLLAPAAFGAFAIAAVWVTVVRSTFYAGAYEYLLKAPDVRAVSTECLAVNVLVGVLLTIPVLLLVPFSAALFGSAAIGGLLLAMLPSNILSAVTAWQEPMVLRTGRLRSYYMVCGGAEIVSGAVAVLMLSRGYGLGALVAQIYTRNLIGLVGFAFLRATILSDGFSVARVREVLRWSSSRYYAGFVSMGTTYSADVLLGLFLSPAAAGLYRASNRIVTAVADVITQPSHLIAMTTVSGRAARGVDASRAWTAVAAITVAIGWSALGGLAVVGPALVPAILGPSWAAAAALVPILCAARSMSVLNGLSGVMLVAHDHQRLAFRFQVAGSIATVGSLLVSAPFGLLPATIGILLSSLVMGVAMLAAVWRLFPGSAATFRRHAAVALAPVAATVAGALAPALLVPTRGAGGAMIGMGLAVGAGVTAWSFAIAVLRRRAMDVVDDLREDGAPAVAAAPRMAAAIGEPRRRAA